MSKDSNEALKAIINKSDILKHGKLIRTEIEHNRWRYSVYRVTLADLSLIRYAEIWDGVRSGTIGQIISIDFLLLHNDIPGTGDSSDGYQTYEVIESVDQCHYAYHTTTQIKLKIDRSGKTITYTGRCYDLVKKQKLQLHHTTSKITKAETKKENEAELEDCFGSALEFGYIVCWTYRNQMTIGRLVRATNSMLVIEVIWWDYRGGKYWTSGDTAQAFKGNVMLLNDNLLEAIAIGRLKAL